MEKEQYGYLKLDKASYDNVMQRPNIGLDIPKTGYNFKATNYICRTFAQQSENCGFIDTADLLNSETRKDALVLIMQEGRHEKLVAGEIPINPKQGQFLLLDEMTTILRLYMSNNGEVNKRFVAPLTIYSEGKESHGVALCIDADKENCNLNIMILEQHAQRDGGVLDYSKEIEETLRHLRNDFRGFSMRVNVFSNEEAICREKGVCGIVSAEVCRQLLNAENPLQLAQAGTIKFDADQVKKLHKENFLSYQKNGLNPLFLTQSKTHGKL